MKLTQLLLPGAVALVGLFLGACSSGTIDDNVEYIPVSTDGNTWGFMSRDGEIILDGEYDNCPSVVYNGYFSVGTENDHYALYTFDKKRPTIVKNCDDLTSVGAFSEGVVPVCRAGERITLVDGNGEKVATLDRVKGKEITVCDAIFCDGLLLAQNEDGKMGYLGHDGKAAIAFKYDRAGTFSEGLAYVGVRSGSDERFSVIDTKGEKVFSLKSGHRPTNIFHEGYMSVENREGGCGFYDKKGEFTKCPSKVKWIGEYNADVYVFRGDNYNYGLMSRDGELLLSAKYDVMSICNDKVVARKDKNVIIFNLKGDEEARISDASAFISYSNFPIMVKSDGEFTCYTLGGELIKKSDFKDYNAFLSIGGVRSDYKNESSTNTSAAAYPEVEIEEEYMEVAADSVAAEPDYFY